MHCTQAFLRKCFFFDYILHFFRDTIPQLGMCIDHDLKLLLTCNKNSFMISNKLGISAGPGDLALCHSVSGG